MDWITDSIALGNFVDANNLKKGEVDAVLNDTRFDVEVIPLVDAAGNDKRLFDGCVDFIDDVITSGDKILVHCHAGRSRSVCILARYFMRKEGLTSHQALAKIEAKREIYLSPGIEEILVL